MRDLLHTKQETILPDHDNTSQLLCDFSNYFADKIQKIRHNLDQLGVGETSPSIPERSAVAPCLSAFAPVTLEDIIKAVLRSKGATCSLDPIPTGLLKTCITAVAPAIRNIVNASLISGDFPGTFKKALVMPLLKKSTLDPNLMKNYRPV